MDVKRTDLHPRPIFCDLEKFCCAQVQGIASCLHAAGTEDQLATIQWCASNSEKASVLFNLLKVGIVVTVLLLFVRIYSCPLCNFKECEIQNSFGGADTVC